MRINRKGQITIPAAIRRDLGWAANTDVELEIVDDALLLRRIRKMPQRGRGAVLLATLRGTADMGMSTDEIMALIRGD